MVYHTVPWIPELNRSRVKQFEGRMIQFVQILMILAVRKGHVLSAAALLAHYAEQISLTWPELPMSTVFTLVTSSFKTALHLCIVDTDEERIWATAAIMNEQYWWDS